MGVFEDLKWRGLVHQATSDDLAAVLNQRKVAMYVGFDPTAASLQAGQLVPLTLMAHFRRQGHQVIALVGGATGMIGDPSGKSAERNLMGLEKIEQNVVALQGQLNQFFATDDGPPVKFVNNLDWFRPISLLDFLRDTGKHFSVNQMIQRDSVRTRLEGRDEGISYTEFTYMLLQAYDFLELNRRHGCELQAGGSDQWGNIVSGVDLIRRISGNTAYGLTASLLTDSEGKKYGKTEKGTVFLSGALTSPYAFYQFWLNTADADVARFVRWLTFVNEDEAKELEAKVGSGERAAQKFLARELTRRVHGSAELDKVIRASEALFSGEVRGIEPALLDQVFAEVPSITLPRSRFEGDGASLIDLLAESGACNSKSDARRQLQQKAVVVNGAQPSAGEDSKVKVEELIEGRMLVLRRGKKNYFVVRAE